MIKSGNINSLTKIINEHSKFVITTHVNPDADAIGSAVAIYYILKKLDKNVIIINHSETPSNLEFLVPDNAVKKYDAKTDDAIINDAEVLIALDLNSLKRTISMKECLEKFKGVKVCIDHHENPENFADLFLLNTIYTSTGEIIYDYIKKSGIVEMDEKIAEAIYSAVMTDTGSFRFERTTSKTHLVTADLLDKGVNPKTVYEKIYDQNKLGRTKLLGRCLSELSLNSSGDICYMIITQKMLEEYETKESDVDGFVNFCLSIEKVQVGILFFELKDGMKISFRSKSQIPVNKIAANYNGGGHYHAAGARLYNVNFFETINKTIELAEKYI